MKTQIAKCTHNTHQQAKSQYFNVGKLVLVQNACRKSRPTSRKYFARCILPSDALHAM